MFTKTLFLVLLGTAFVLSNPVPEAGNTEVSVPAVADEKKVENVDSKDDDEPEIDFLSELIESVEGSDVTTAPPNKGKIKKFLNWVKKGLKKIDSIKDKGTKFSKDVAEKFNNLKKKGQKLVNDAINLYNKGKTVGKELYDEISRIAKEAKALWKTASESGKEVYNTIKEITHKESKKA